VITVKLLRKHDSGTHVRYLYTTDLSLSGEEACLAGDRGPQRDVKAHSSFWGLRGLPHDLHRQQRRQGAGGGAEPEERGGVPQVLERHLGGPPGLMKIFKLR